MRKKTLLSILLAGCFGGAALGQGLSTINGTVSDPSGAVIGGARVTATETDTGVSRATLTNAGGLYVLSSLRPTSYSLRVEAPGFRTFTQTGITLQADDKITINSKLELGSANESVTVEAAAAQVDTSTATVKQVVDSSRIVELPLNGRNAATLTTLVPGAVIAPNEDADQGITKSFPVVVVVSTNGGRDNQVSYFLDGVPNTDFLSNVNLPFPMPDALQEFSVQTSNYSAESGQSNGGVVNIVTKSGTNAFHGDAFDYVRNGEFNARNFFASAVDPLKRQQFGGVVGGPVKRDRAFFFAGYEGTRLRNVTGGLKAFVPTPTDVAGDFSAFLTASNPNNPSARAIALKDPTNNQPFPGNQIPTERFDPASLALLSWLPAAGGNGLAFYSKPVAQNFDEFTGKGDYNISTSDRVAFRYFVDRLDNPAVLANHNLLTYTDFAKYLVQNAGVQEIHVFSPGLLNDFRFGFMRESDRRGPPPNTPNVKQLGVSITQGPVSAMEGINTSGFFNFGSFPEGQFPRTGFSWSDTVRWVKGRHSLVIGGSFERDRLNEFTDTNSNGVFAFAGNITGSALSDFMLGRLQTFTQGNGYIQANRYNLFSLYVQDTFKVSSRLTLDYGLRWEPATPWHDLYHEDEVFSAQAYAAGTKSIVYPNAPAGELFSGDPGIPIDGRRSDWLNFGPRLGFAYDLFGKGKTSIRGGVGEFFASRTPGFANNRQSQATPFSLAVTLTQPQGPFSNPYVGVPNPFPAPLPPAHDIVFPKPVLVYSLNPTDSRLSPNTYAGNLTIEHQLAENWLVRAAYVFSRSNHINAILQVNPSVYIPGSALSTDARRIYPGFSGIPLSSSGANSWYNSLQLTLQKRLSQGFTVLVNYTYSKSQDDVPNGTDSVGVVTGATYAMPSNMQGFQNLDRGPSEYDFRHVISISYVWHLPELAHAGRALREIAGGWQLNGIVRVQSGAPITVLAGTDRSLSGVGYDRGVLSGTTQQIYLSGPCASSAPCVNWLNPQAFALPASGTFGNLGRSAFRGPGIFGWDMAMTKVFPIRERVSAQFRLEYFNALNHTNFNNPGASINSAGFGTITSATDPRIAQLALKIFF